MRDLVVTTLLIVEGPPFIKLQGRGDRSSRFCKRLNIMTRIVVVLDVFLYLMENRGER